MGVFEAVEKKFSLEIGLFFLYFTFSHMGESEIVKAKSSIRGLEFLRRIK